MNADLYELLELTDPSTPAGRAVPWALWSRDVRPVLADVLERLGEPLVHSARTVQPFPRECSLITAGPVDLPAAYQGEQPSGGHDHLFLPPGWNVFRIDAQERTRSRDRGGRIMLGRVGEGGWPPRTGGGVIRLASYGGNKGVVRVVEERGSLGIVTPAVIGVPDEGSPPVCVEIRFRCAAGSFRCDRVLSSVGYVERKSLADVIVSLYGVAPR